MDAEISDVGCEDDNNQVALVDAERSDADDDLANNLALAAHGPFVWGDHGGSRVPDVLSNVSVQVQVSLHEGALSPCMDRVRSSSAICCDKPVATRATEWW